jgi:uncharacterized protein (TIGR03000 family)
VYLTGKYEWVKVYRCYHYGTPYDKEAEQAEGYQKAAANMPGKGTIALVVPAAAKVTINDRTYTPTADSTRYFETHALGAGETVTYTVTAEFVRDGRTVTVRKEFTARPNQESLVDLSDATGTAVVAK